MLDSNLVTYVASLSYFGIFLWFAVIEQFTPIPEEVSLMSLGYIAGHASLSPWLSGVVALLGLLAVDNLLFYLTLKGSKWPKKLIAKVSPKLMGKINNRLKTHSVATVLVLAMIPKIRFLSPIVSAAAMVPWRVFITVNSLATLFYVTLYMVIGLYFHSQMQSVVKTLDFAHHGIFIGVMVAISAALFFIYRRVTR